MTALENTAGARLFHVVVRDDAVAARVIAHYRAHKSGRVTLLPLAQLREAAVRTQLRRSTVRTPKWDPHQERPESVRITRITLSATISETTTILIANFTGPST